MSRFWMRLRRPLTWVAGIALALYLVVILLAWIGVSFTGQGGPTQSIGPADATRNLFNVAGAAMRTYVFFVLQLLTLPLAIVAQFALIFWFLGRGTTYTIYPGQYDVTFDDVRGQDHIVRSTREVMSLFQGFKEFRKVGGYPPRGILFEGPPGTGKTLLAKAIAGETGVPFMYASGAGFANMFLGIPQYKVRSMFKKARRYSARYGGCVVFIDELDAIGGSRTGTGSLAQAWPSLGWRSTLDRVVVPGMGGGSNLVNALLTEMDGVDKPPRFEQWFRRRVGLKPRAVARHNLLIIGATNMASTLDAALLRPGRFDRKIHVGIPAAEGRAQILAYYLNKVAHEPIDIDRVARLTQGYSPASVRNIVNEALIFALQDGRQALRYDDLWRAILTDEVGLAEPVKYSSVVKAKTATHEAAHALAIHFLAPNRTVSIITVRKRGGALGVVFGHETEEEFGATRSEMRANIKVSLAGLVSEEMWYGESSTGPSSDLMNASRNVLAMVTLLAMGEDNMLSFGLLMNSPLHDPVSFAMSKPEIYTEANRILRECKEETRQFLEERRHVLEHIRDVLVERDEISGDEFREILFRIGAVDTMPAQMRPVPLAPAWVGTPPPGGGAPGWAPPGVPVPGWGAPPTGWQPPQPGNGHGAPGGPGGAAGGSPTGWGADAAAPDGTPAPGVR